MEFHDFLCEINFSRTDRLDGWYAIPLTFTEFNPETGTPVLQFDDEGDEIGDEGFVYIGDDSEDEAYRAFALMIHEDDFSDAAVTSEGRDTFKIGRREYLVLTDEEAESMYDGMLNQYIDDCLDIPENIRPYFDDDAWKRDARMDGRGMSLSGYDGDEVSIQTHIGTFYIYRQS